VQAGTQQLFGAAPAPNKAASNRQAAHLYCASRTVSTLIVPDLLPKQRLL